MQVVESDFATAFNTSAQIPYDNTIPQITEGTEAMTLAITPKSATNQLFIEVWAYGSCQAIGEFIAALFRDSTANAIGADSVTVAAAGFLVNVYVAVKVTAGSTSATTFRTRIGSAGGVNTAFNGYASGGTYSQAFGTTPKSSMKITEYKP